MILRNIAIRHGRKALAAPVFKSHLIRCFTTETSSEISSIERSIENHSKETHSIEANLNQLHITQHFAPPSSAGEGNAVAEVFSATKHTAAITGKLGSVLDRQHYEPHQLVLNPPRPQDVTLELLMASQAHMGHATGLWNPANQRYIYGVRQGIHIISLEVTAAHLRRAAKVVEGVAYHGGLILFVGTRAGQAPAVVKAAKLARGCHLFERWTPGSITNGEQILKKCALKVLDPLDNELDGFEEKIADWKALKPDLVVCMNPLENYVLLHECGLHNIPTVGVVDTDADPTWVTYPIPANDDSLRCIEVIAGVLGRAGEEGQRKRIEAAKTGEVTWFPPQGLGKPLNEEEERRKDDKEAAAAAERKAKQAQKEKEELEFASYD